MKSPARSILPLAALILLAAGAGGAVGKSRPVGEPVNGPAADYPVVIGDPYAVDGTTYTPSDRLNSDEVGYAQVGEAGGQGVSVAHKTLPLPSYVEVTALDSGKTILARVERRGPMNNDRVVELSPGAATQLGITAGARAPIRVRRVNPPEQERALLRAGKQSPERMETPKGLLSALMRKLEAKEPLSKPATSPTPAPPTAPTAVARPTAKPSPASKPSTPKAAPATGVPSPAAPSRGGFSVQVGAFSTPERARKVAGQLDGNVIHPGKYWLTRLGPFATRAQADAALAKARAAGYSDARILRAD